jgi:hypothetical protein
LRISQEDKSLCINAFSRAMLDNRLAHLDAVLDTDMNGNVTRGLLCFQTANAG